MSQTSTSSSAARVRRSPTASSLPALLPVARDVPDRPVPAQPRRAVQQRGRGRRVPVARLTNTLAVWLQQAGYYTGHIGKYLNGYEQVPNTIPPGWTEWHGSTRTYQFYGYQLNEQGALVDYGTTADQYSTDVYTQKAVDFVHRRAPESQPFFLWLAYLAPHGGGPNPSPQPPDDCQSTAKPAPRHANAFDDEPLPQPPSFNEADVSDKPAAIQSRAPLTDAQTANIQREYRCRHRVAARRRRRRRPGDPGAARPRASSRTRSSSTPPTTGSSTASTASRWARRASTSPRSGSR